MTDSIYGETSVIISAVFCGAPISTRSVTVSMTVGISRAAKTTSVLTTAACDSEVFSENSSGSRGSCFFIAARQTSHAANATAAILTSSIAQLTALYATMPALITAEP